MDRFELIEYLGLEPHIEGGYFKRTFQADHREKVQGEAGPRYTMTSIFYLLTNEQSRGEWHLNQSDILHFFHLGDPIEYALIFPCGRVETIVLGSDLQSDQQLQLAVAGGVWKSSRLLNGREGYGLVSEAVSPGFEYSDMQIRNEAELIQVFPSLSHFIRRGK